MDRDTELGIVARLRQGDHDAFDAVYDEFNVRLYNFLARLSRSRDVADDLLEETWLRLVANAERLRPDTRLGAWLFTVARNVHVSYCRSRTIDESRECGPLGLWPTSPCSPSPFEGAAASEMERRVERAIAALPARYRETLLLVAVEGFSPAEAATICQVSPENLRQRLSRARAMLARKVDRLDEGPSAVLREVTP
jgi:RNA polymerase sigma-70 factor (ECF subfamily)